MKNPNGFGTVNKLSGKRRKKWRAMKTIGWENGKQKRVTVGYFESKQEAMEALGKYNHNPNAKIKIKDIYEMWSNVHYKNIAENSKKSMHSKYTVYISKFADRYISDINLQELQEFFNKINSSSSTLSLIKVVFNMIFDYAVKNNFIEKNPIQFIELKKFKKVYDKKVFTDEEIQILWDNVNKPYVDTILILIYTGMRVSEMLNLKLSDIDLEKRTIFIPKSKTNAGIRTIPIHEKIFMLIVKRMHNQEYLITSRQGKNYSHFGYKYNFDNTLKSLGIYPHTPHECRHTTATLLSNAGANPISISKIMGHSNYTEMTAKVYTHKNSEELEKAIKTLN